MLRAWCFFCLDSMNNEQELVFRVLSLNVGAFFAFMILPFNDVMLAIVISVAITDIIVFMYWDWILENMIV